MTRNHANEMADLEQQFNNGCKRAVLDVLLVCVCAFPEKPVPDWAKRAFAKGMHDVTTARANCWDDVFGIPHPRRKIEQIRKEAAIRSKLFSRVCQLRRQRPEEPRRHTRHRCCRI